MGKFLARRGISPVVLSACQLGVASVWLAIALGLTGAPSPRLDATVVASVLILGLVGTGAAYVLNYQIIASVGATVASIVTYLLPIVAIILGFVVLGEHITLLDLAGITLILAGVALTRTRAAQASTTTDRHAAGMGAAMPRFKGSLTGLSQEVSMARRGPTLPRWGGKTIRAGSAGLVGAQHKDIKAGHGLLSGPPCDYAPTMAWA